MITSAGLVLAGTFAALGSLLDTMIVRSVLVTALTLDVGRWMWWPSELSKHHEPLPVTGGSDPEPALAGAGG
ncbi:MMPL family transporter [Micromonospora pallida]|uniref:MMPL family transporter n=1 Tax=Micromonospora pallida TaxID=145854 RepID=UPI003CCC2923